MISLSQGMNETVSILDVLMAIPRILYHDKSRNGLALRRPCKAAYIKPISSGRLRASTYLEFDNGKGTEMPWPQGV